MIKPLPVLSERDAARFWSRVSRGGPDDCWPWQGGAYSNGYPRFCVQMGNFVATRIAYQVHTGQDPGDLFVCHSCDNPPCCNPAHLFLGSHLENVRDAVAKGRNDCGRGDRHGARTHPERFLGRFERRFTEAQVRAIRSEYAGGGVSTLTLAERHGVSDTTIGHMLRGNTWAHVAASDGLGRISDPSRRGKPGASNNSAKLDEDAVRAIRRLYREGGHTCAALAQQFGVSDVAVGFIVKRRTWKHVSDD